MANNNPHPGGGNGDTAQNPALGSQVSDQTTAYDPSQISAMDQKIASDYGIPVSQLSPELISQYSQEVAARSGGTWGQTVMPLLGDVAVGLTTGGIGAGLGAALAPALGTIGGAAAGAGIAGAGAGALQAYGTGNNIGKSALTGGALGAVGGALSAGVGSQASGALNNATGIGPVASSALTKGAIGAGVGALGGELTGGNVGRDALLGGASGAASGAVGTATGSPALGQISGTIAGLGASTLLPSKGVSVPTTVPGAPTAASSLSALPTDPNAGPTNIGSYSGYGYAPRQQVQNPVSNYATYGQGPEANFFQPAGAPPASQAAPYSGAPGVSNTQPIPLNIPTIRH
jgi:hypothetical protein